MYCKCSHCTNVLQVLVLQYCETPGLKEGQRSERCPKRVEEVEGTRKEEEKGLSDSCRRWQAWKPDITVSKANYMSSKANRPVTFYHAFNSLRSDDSHRSSPL